VIIARDGYIGLLEWQFADDDTVMALEQARTAT
jgi:hypothetical protein